MAFISRRFYKSGSEDQSNNTIIVSDATCFAGMAPGEYRMHIGGDVVLDKNKRVSLKGEPGLLAGAAKSLLENVETLLDHRLCSLGAAWQMASLNVSGFLNLHGKYPKDDQKDRVIFTTDGASVLIQKVIKKGKVVFGK